MTVKYITEYEITHKKSQERCNDAPQHTEKRSFVFLLEVTLCNSSSKRNLYCFTFCLKVIFALVLIDTLTFSAFSLGFSSAFPNIVCDLFSCFPAAFTAGFSFDGFDCETLSCDAFNLCFTGFSSSSNSERLL